jgi:hypothetical protein
VSKNPNLEGVQNSKLEKRLKPDGYAKVLTFEHQRSKSCILEYNPAMRTIEISEKAFQVIERLRRSKGVTRTEALETLVQEGATIAQANSILDAPNPKMQDRTDDEIMQIATDAVKQDRRERRH